jgi:hypothetical protein
MDFRGIEVSKEQLEQSVRLSRALLAVAQVMLTEHQHAVAGGLGVFLEQMRLYRTKEEVLSVVSEMLDMMEEYGSKVDRALNGPELKIVPDPK